MTKLVFIVPHSPNISPSQRFRLELYEKALHTKQIDFKYLSFLDESASVGLYQKGGIINKAMATIGGFVKRITTLTDVNKADFVFVHREATPVGPPLFEWIYAKVLRKKIIYDFDDAIWVASPSNPLESLVKCHWKIRLICKWAYKVSVGNDFLFNYAKQFNTNVILNPTCVDTSVHLPVSEKPNNKNLITIGWTGSHTTLMYLETIVPVLQELQKKYEFKCRIICSVAPQFSLNHLEFVKWQEVTEIVDLQQIDIGLMPLTNDEWSSGKCGFKLIQYMALEIPAVASPVGVNAQIIQNGVNGFLCSSPQEWYNALEALLIDHDVRQKMGKMGRSKIALNYSLKVNQAVFLGLIE